MIREKVLDIGAGQRVQFVALTREASRLEVEDAFFNTASAVFLPDVPGGPLGTGPFPKPFTNIPLWAELHRSQDAFATGIRTQPFDPDDSGGGTTQRETGLHVILAALRFLERHPSHALVVAGHADRSGDAAFNQRLSGERGKSAVSLLEARRPDFINACAKFNVSEDDPVVLHYAARTRGWPCDPASPARASAEEIRAFQQSFNDEFGAALHVDGIVGNDTRGAYFDLYQDDLETAAGGKAAMQSLRSHLRFLDAGHKVLALGERFPREHPEQDGLKSQQNRRVELLFFAPPRVPDVAAADAGEQIYRRKLFRFVAEDRDALAIEAPRPAGAERPTRLTSASPPQPGVVEPAEPLVTKMPAAGEIDRDDALAFLEPFDRYHPEAGHQGDRGVRPQGRTAVA